MEELFDTKVINDLFLIRCDGLEAQYVRKYGKTEKMENGDEAEEILREFIEEKSKDENETYGMLLALDEIKGGLMDEIHVWDKAFYKKGFIDAIMFTNELKTIPNEEDKSYNKIMDKIEK